MFLEKAFSGKNDIGRWIALIMIVIGAIYFIGLVPLGIVMLFNLNDNPDLIAEMENPFDLWSYDISPVTGLALSVFPFVIGLLALLLLIKPIHERPVISLFTGTSSFRWKRFFWALLVWLILISVYTLISAAAGFQKFHSQYQRQDFINLIIVSLLLLSVKSVFEETFFRGYLMQGFTKLFLNRWMPVLVTALLFTILHYFYPEVKVLGLRPMFPQYFLFGVFLGICTVMDDGLELALAINFISTVFFSVFFTEQSNATQTPALFNITDNNNLIELIGLLLISTLFLQVTKRRFSWPDWNYLFTKIKEPEIADEMSHFEDFGLLDEYEGEE